MIRHPALVAAIAASDQHAAACNEALDHAVNEIAAELQGDGGLDPNLLAMLMSNRLQHLNRANLAQGLAYALVRLARQKAGIR